MRSCSLESDTTKYPSKYLKLIEESNCDTYRFSLGSSISSSQLRISTSCNWRQDIPGGILLGLLQIQESNLDILGETYVSKLTGL